MSFFSFDCSVDELVIDMLVDLSNLPRLHYHTRFGGQKKSR